MKLRKYFFFPFFWSTCGVVAFALMQQRADHDRAVGTAPDVAYDAVIAHVHCLPPIPPETARRLSQNAIKEFKK
jgi:hypothetical protein